MKEGFRADATDVELFGIYRDYVKHEDDLINYRATWFMASQIPLFGGYAYLAQRQFGGQLNYADSIDDSLGRLAEIPFSLDTLLILVLASFGAFAAWRSYRSIRAAVIAIDALKAKWQRLMGEEHPLLPGLTGGGNNDAHRIGHELAGYLPLAAFVVWLLVISLHSLILVPAGGA